MEQALIISSVVLWTVVLFNLLLTLALVRRLNSSSTVNSLSQAENGLKPGELAPDFSAKTLNGEIVTLESYSGRDVAFIFVGPDCGPCREALPSYEALRPKAKQAGVDLVLVSTGDDTQTRLLATEFQLQPQLLVATERSNPFMKDYQMRGTPSFTLVNAQGRIQSAGFPTPQSGQWKALADSWQSTSSLSNGEVVGKGVVATY